MAEDHSSLLFRPLEYFPVREQWEQIEKVRGERKGKKKERRKDDKKEGKEKNRLSLLTGWSVEPASSAQLSKDAHCLPFYHQRTLHIRPYCLAPVPLPSGGKGSKARKAWLSESRSL